MSFRLYKEGQGKWARGALATTLALVGLVAAVNTYDWLRGNNWGAEQLFQVPVFNLAVKLQDLSAVLIFVPFVLAGIWYYNQPKVTDFLIETENELENKVTWPTRPETTKNSLVVVVTCVVIMGWIWLADKFFEQVMGFVYG